MKNLALRPNCLLTRSPLIFISGPRSLFSPHKTADKLQDYLAAHGYQVYSIPMSFRSKTLRQKNLKDWLQVQKTKKFHFILDSLTFSEFQTEFESQLNTSSPSLTFTVISLETKSKATPPTTNFSSAFLFPVQPLPKKSIPLSYKFHQVFCHLLKSKAVPYEECLFKYKPLDYDRFLDHCIKLAENEFST